MRYTQLKNSGTHFAAKKSGAEIPTVSISRFITCTARSPTTTAAAIEAGDMSPTSPRMWDKLERSPPARGTVVGWLTHGNLDQNTEYILTDTQYLTFTWYIWVSKWAWYFNMTSKSGSNLEKLIHFPIRVMQIYMDLSYSLQIHGTQLWHCQDWQSCPVCDPVLEGGLMWLDDHPFPIRIAIWGEGYTLWLFNIAMERSPIFNR